MLPPYINFEWPQIPLAFSRTLWFSAISLFFLAAGLSSWSLGILGGNSNMGRAQNILHPAQMIKPSHQAPTHLGSFCPISGSENIDLTNFYIGYNKKVSFCSISWHKILLFDYVPYMGILACMLRVQKDYYSKEFSELVWKNISGTLTWIWHSGISNRFPDYGIQACFYLLL